MRVIARTGPFVHHVRSGTLPRACAEGAATTTTANARQAVRRQRRIRTPYPRACTTPCIAFEGGGNITLDLRRSASCSDSPSPRRRSLMAQLQSRRGLDDHQGDGVTEV